MSDLFKLLFTTILHCALLTSPTLMAQETPPAVNASAQQPESEAAVDPEDPQHADRTTPTESGTITLSGTIMLELRTDPASDEPLRKLAEAIAATHKEIQVRGPGTSASSPELIEAELRLKRGVEFDTVDKLIGDLARFGIARVVLSGPYGTFEDQNMVVINAPANKPWRLIHDIETYLAELDGFEFDVRVRANDNPPTSTFTDSGTALASPILGESESYRPSESLAATEIPVEVAAITNEEIPESIKTQIIQLEIELAELRSKYGSNHPKVVSLENKLAAVKKLVTPNMQETPAVPNADNVQLKIFNLQNSNANDAAEVVIQLYSGRAAIAVDERTNAVIVRADESRLSEIEAVLLRLDSTETAGKNSGTTIQRSSVASEPGTSIAEYRAQLDALEQPVLQLAEQVRAAETKQGKDHPDSAKLRADLRAAVQQTFAARQEIQRAELAEFTRRLQRMQQSIDARDRIADKVIDRRLEELLDPNVAWTQMSTPLVQSESTSLIQPPEPKSISEVSEEKQTVSVTLFAVKDDGFLQQVINADPSEQRIAPNDLDEQLASMLKNRTATVLGKHAIETTLNETATFHSGGAFNVPSADSQSKTPIEFGTRIQIVPELVGGERVFDIVWNERFPDKKNDVFGLPGIKEWQTRVVVKSPQAGGTGYIVGPLTGHYNNYRRFIHFFLHGAASASSTTDSKHGPSVTPVIGVPKKLLEFNSIEAEITFTIPGEERKVFYWRGFPIDGTNTAVVARDNMHPASNAEQAKADLEIFRKSVESISVITRVDHKLRSLPAKIERIDSDLGLLLVSIGQEHVFESLPFDPVGPATGQRFETDPGTLRHWRISSLTNVSQGVKRAELSKNFDSTWCGTPLMDPTCKRFIGLAITLPGGTPETKYGIIPAPEIVKWLEASSDSASLKPISPEIDVLKDAMQGEWIIEQFTLRLEDVREWIDADNKLTIDGTLLSTRTRWEGGVLDTVMLLDFKNSGSPHSVDVILDPNGDKEQHYGIIDCTADRIRLCFNSGLQNNDSGRPKLLAPGSEVIFIEARRPIPKESISEQIPEPGD